jgi:hypothetical protein
LEDVFFGNVAKARSGKLFHKHKKQIIRQIFREREREMISSAQFVYNKLQPP